MPRTSLPGISSRIAFSDSLTDRIFYPWANPSPTYMNGYWGGGTPAPEGVGRSCVAYRHHGTANAVFFDGHVERLDPAALFQPAMFYDPSVPIFVYP